MHIPTFLIFLNHCNNNLHQKIKKYLENKDSSIFLENKIKILKCRIF